jgi:methionyl-tRNA formyltransferase
VGERLAHVGARLLVPSLTAYVAGELRPVPQDDSLATYAPKITPSEGRIDWSENRLAIINKVRGLNPVPGAWTMLGDQRVKLHRVTAADHPELRPGELLVAGGLVAGTGEGSVSVEEAQIAGKRSMMGEELARGLRLEPGAHFE